MIRIVMALLVGLGALLALPLAPSPALAVDAAADGKRRIDLAGLARVGGLWADYAAAIRAARADGIVTAGQPGGIARLNLPVLAEMNRTVWLTERTYGSRSVPLGLAIALNVSGRQRMLTQKMSRELCLIGHGLEPEANRKALAETVAVFEASLDALVTVASDNNRLLATTNEAVFLYERE